MRSFKSCLLVVLGFYLLGSSGFSQTLQTLYRFGAQPPSNPDGGVILGSDGNYYGTTYFGGAYNNGTIYRLTPNGVLTDLVDFNGTNGAYPYAGLVSDNHGNFYGTTQHGGDPGYGTIFRVTTNGVLTTLQQLSLPTGANPQGALIFGSADTLYGTTFNGGANSKGTIFSITTNGVFNTIVSFATTNGANPASSLLLAHDGNFYGTTEFGGPNGFGTVFQLTPGGMLTILGAFDFANNGLFPVSSLVEDNAGNLFGTSTLGGGGGAGSGALFEVPATNQQVILGIGSFHSSPESGLVSAGNNLFYGVTQSYIYRFNTVSNSVNDIFDFANGNAANAVATPILDANGSLLGTTYNGGTNGYGTVYKLDTATNYTEVYSFSASSGAQPLGGVVQGNNGVLYGTTSTGGIEDNGTVFSLTTNGVLKVLVTFASTNGAYPYDGLLLGTNGLLYGTTRFGGGNGSGAGQIFSVSTNGTNFQSLAVLNQTQAAYPAGGLVRDSSGNLYGNGVEGGAYNYGAVFKVATNGTVTTLANFDLTNGENPECTLTLDNTGNLWGTTAGGGPGLGFGTIFKLSTNGIPSNTYLTPFATFNGTDGSIPVAGLTLGPDGAYYGTTEAGGKYNYGCVYRLGTDGTITNLVSFAGGNGAYPLAPLILGTNGVFYGTTAGAGLGRTVSNGTVFSVTTNGLLTTLIAFNGTNGAAPSAPLLIGQDGAFYGTTANGSGASGGGTVFRLLPGPVTTIPLNIQSKGSSTVLTWTNPVFNLQSATNLAGPFLNVPDSFSPYTNVSKNQALFFRLKAEKY